MPIKFNLARLNDGEDIKSTFNNNIAIWSKLCRVHFNDNKMLSCAKSYQCKATINSKYLWAYFMKKEEIYTMHLPSSLMSKSQWMHMYLTMTNLIRKLSEGDLFGIDAKYHTQCLVSFYNNAPKLEKQRKLNPK